MYARRKTRPKPRKSSDHKFAAPTAGWVANRNLSDPSLIEGPGAAILDNFFPKSSSVKLRRGKALYATLGEGDSAVGSIFSYVNGENQRIFAANDTTIYNITSVTFPYDFELVDDETARLVTESGDWFGASSTNGFDVASGYSSGHWVTAQFATTGGVYLIGVNGTDDGFIFDGADFWPNVAGGITRVEVDGGSGLFLAGDTLTGSTSSANGTIHRVVEGTPGSYFLYLYDVTGTFVDNETVDSSSGGSASVNGDPELTVAGVAFPDGLSTADMSYVWVYKNRLWFAQKNSMNAWYLDVDSIGGTATLFPFAGVFGRGGSLLFGAAWSLDAGSDVGLSEQAVFVSSEGEVAVYQGANPSSAEDWNRVGIYRIGKPLGPRAHFRGGGDLAIATSVGLVPLSKAINLDVTSLNVATVSYKIADAWSDAVTLRGMNDWQCEVWPEQKMAVISPPNLEGANEPVLFVSNTETGAWARFTNWHALCMDVFQGTLYFGSPEGKIFLANVSGADEGEAYTGKVIPLFNDMGSAAAAKIGKVGRAVTRANAITNGRVSLNVDYNEQAIAPPDATPLITNNRWATGIWGQSQWSAATPQKINQAWASISGVGYCMSLCYQVTSGSTTPLDDEVIRMDMLYETAEAVT